MPVNTEAESRRQAAVDRLMIVDTFEEKAFDDLTRLVQQTFQTPIALITFLDHNRNWFKSRIGLEQSETPRELALCNHLLAAPQAVLVVPDAASDERFSTNPLVIGAPGIRFYAGAPLMSSDGHVLGAICAIDTQPRQVDDDKVETLLFLAQQVMTELERRRKSLAT